MENWDNTWHKYPELPKKPNKKHYEQIPCYCILKDQRYIRRLQWNCEHECWDTEDGDDAFTDAEGVVYWMLEPEISLPDELCQG